MQFFISHFSFLSFRIHSWNFNPEFHFFKKAFVFVSPYHLRIFHKSDKLHEITSTDLLELSQFLVPPALLFEILRHIQSICNAFDLDIHCSAKLPLSNNSGTFRVLKLLRSLENCLASPSLCQ